jgi:hypothetical protein
MVLPDLGAYSADSDTQGMYSLCEISRSPERGVAGSNELPKRLNAQKGWKRLHVALAAESACLSPIICGQFQDSKITAQLSETRLVTIRIQMTPSKELMTLKLMLTPLDSVKGDDDTEVDVDSVETFPDDRIEVWLHDQIED